MLFSAYIPNYVASFTIIIEILNGFTELLYMRLPQTPLLATRNLLEYPILHFARRDQVPLHNHLIGGENNHQFPSPITEAPIM
jgi:hypothetical protein